jgi:hypothetical protein
MTLCYVSGAARTIFHVFIQSGPSADKKRIFSNY